MLRLKKDMRARTMTIVALVGIIGSLWTTNTHALDWQDVQALSTQGVSPEVIARVIEDGHATWSQEDIERCSSQKVSDVICTAIRGRQRETSRDAYTTVGSPKYAGLIIGVNHYLKPAKYPDLSTPEADATALSTVLMTKYHFTKDETTILLGENATSERILEEMDELASLASDDPTYRILVSFSGHGQLINNSGYLVPYDAGAGGGSATKNLISIADVRERLTNLESQHVLALIDACHAGSIFPVQGIQRDVRLDFDPKIAFEAKVSLYRRLDANKSRYVITSAARNERADDNYNDSGHSPFSYFLLKELNENNDSFMRASQLGPRVQQAVTTNYPGAPLPGVGPWPGSGDAGGDFTLILE